MNDVSQSRIIRAIVSVGTSSLFRIVLGFLAVTIAARIIPTDQFGAYFLVVVAASLLQVIGGLGLQLSATRFIASAPTADDRQRIANNILTLRLLTLVAVVPLALVCKPLFLYLFPSELLSSLFAYVPVLFIFQLTEITFLHVMQGFHLYRKMALIQIVASVLNFALVCLFLLTFRLGVAGLLVATIISLAVTVAACYTAIPIRKSLILDRAIVRQIVRFGLPLQGNEILSFIFQRIDVLLLGSLLGPAYIAYLEVANKIPTNLQRLYESLFAVYVPQMSGLFGQGQRARAEAMMNSVLRLVTFTTMLCALIFILFQQEIIIFIFSEKYMLSGPALAILSVALGIAMTSQILDYALIAAGHPGYIPLISLIGTPIISIANFILIPSFGLMGAVCARLIANLLTNPISLLCQRRVKIHARISEYLKPMAILALCVAIYYILGWNTLFFKMLVLALFIVLSNVFTVITRVDATVLVSSLTLHSRQAATQK